AQNTTPMQMKMFLTRLGEGSRMVVTGDPSQVDLPPGARSGLAEALETLAGVDGIAIVHFSDRDVVRHEFVARIVRAYEARGRGARRGYAMTPGTPRMGVICPCAAGRRACPEAKELARTGAALALARGMPAVGIASEKAIELSITLSDDDGARRLNRRWRG